MGDATLLGHIGLNTGALLALEERFDEADIRLRQVISRAQRRGDLSMEAQAMVNLGYADLRALRDEEAVEWFKRAIPVFAKTNDRLNRAKAIGNLGWAYLSLGALDNALVCFNGSVALASEIGSLDQITSSNGAAEVLLSQGKYREAAAKSRRALELARKSRSAAWETDALDGLAESALELDSWRDAQRYNEESRALSHRLRNSGRLTNNREVDAKIAAGRGQYADAERLFLGVLSSSGEDPSVRLDAESGLAKLYALEGRQSRAETEFRAAIGYSETLRGRLKKDEDKVTYQASLMGLFRDYVSFLMANHREAAALEAADSSRARVLSEKLIQEPKPRTAHEFQEFARRARCALLSYWLGPKESYLWVVTPRGIATFTLPGENEIAGLAGKYQSFIEESLGDPLETHDEAGASLWRVLIGPAKKLIPPGMPVILVPDGVLHSINFETLPVPGERWHYWIEDATVRIAPSLSLLLSKRTPRGASKGSLLLVGDPLSPGPDFPALPHAADEMRRVSRHFSASTSSVYEGARAQAAIYRTASPGRFQVIHFATHSLPNRLSPLDSALILSPRDGVYKLLASDIAEVPLRANLVTISACKSAGAKTYSGEGEVGLAWAFLQAGASNVIAGLWDVDDTYTPDLMDELYSGIDRGLSPGRALQQAKLRMIHSRTVAHKPYYWGSFLLFTGGGR